MRTTGYVGRLDEGARFWMNKIMFRTKDIRVAPDILSKDYYSNSLKYSQSLYPNLSFKLASEDIANPFYGYYRGRGYFYTVLFPDVQSVFCSAISDDDVFFYPPKDNADEEDVLPFDVDMVFDEYLNSRVHVSEIDFLAEILFSPVCRTVEIFERAAAALALSTVPAPTSTFDWTAYTLARKTAELAGFSALKDWTQYMRDARQKVNVLNSPAPYTRLSCYYGQKLKELAMALKLGDTPEYDEYVEKNITEPNSKKEELSEYDEKLLSIMFSNAEVRVAAGNILYTAYMGMAKGAYSDEQKGDIFMGGLAPCVSYMTGFNHGTQEHLTWLLHTACLYQDMVVYALSLERWTKEELDALEAAVKRINSSCLLVWTSEDKKCVPKTLLEGDWIPSSFVDPDAETIMFTLPRELTESEQALKRGIISDSVNHPAASDGEMIIGSIPKETAEKLKERRKDPLYNTAADYGSNFKSVVLPYEMLPEDRIEEARNLILEMRGLRDAVTMYKINKPTKIAEE